VLILASPQDQLALYHVAACHIDDYQFKPLSPDRLEQYLEGRRQDGLELAGLGRPERPPLPDVPQVRQKYFPASGQFLSPSGPNTADSSRR
jgi:hypothetical protein